MLAFARRVFRHMPRRVTLAIGDLREPDGRNAHVVAAEAGRKIVLDYRARHLDSDAVLRSLAHVWDPSKVALLFEKEIELAAQADCYRARLASILAGEHHPGTRPVLMLRRHGWSYGVEAYCSSLGVDLRTYKVAKTAPSPVGLARRVYRRFLANLRPARARPAASGPAQPSTGRRRETVAVGYGYRSLSLDPDERSEFFWLAETAREFDVLVYDFVSSSGVSAEDVSLLRSHGIRVFGRAPGIPVWTPPRSFYTLAARRLAEVVKAAARGKVGLRGALPLDRLMALAIRTAYWETFFRAERVHAHLGVPSMTTDVAKSIALDAVGAVSIGYQHSVSYLTHPKTSLYGAGEDVQFVFAPAFAEGWLRMSPPPSVCLCSGYLYDAAVHRISAGTAASMALRDQLRARGATHVLCFFDENSDSRWSSFATNAEASSDYEFLARWVLESPHVGLIMKPKKMSNLFERIAPALGVLREAEATGRCVFMTPESSGGHVYPAEAAIATDLCVGKLTGGTAAMEAHLAGVRTILVDTDGLIAHPFRDSLGPDVVFDGWESARAAAERHWAGGDAGAFGNWGAALDQLDSFRDGRARERIHGFAADLIRARRSGAAKPAAIAAAVAEFGDRWGQAAVIPRSD